MRNEKTVTTKLMMSLYAMASHQGFLGVRTGNNDLDLFVLNQWIRKRINIHILIELDYEEGMYRINACNIQREPEWMLNKIYDKYLFKNYEFALFTGISEFLKQNYL